MFISIGDGGNYVQVPDPFNQAQNLQRALGKIFRIDPLKQSDGKPYGIPSDNPFVGKPPALGEIWAYGLRHPQNISFDLGGDGTFMIADIGQEHIEEIDIGVKGANYGWPNREGTFVTDRADGQVLYAPPVDDTKKGYTPRSLR
jgi:glucose/arabinose dehydrogenase